MSLGSPIIFLNEDSNSYYEAYTDGVYVGNPGVTFEDPTAWGRKRLGSKVKATSTAWEESLLLSEYVEGDLRTAEIYGGNPRFAKAFDNRFFYKDSTAPDVAKIFATGSFGSGSACYPDENGVDFNDLIGNERYFSVFFSTNGYLTSSNNGQRISNTEWQFSYPFEKKYLQLGRGETYATSGLFGSINDLNFKYNTDFIVAIPRDKVNIIFVSGSLANSQLGVKTYTFFTQRTRVVPIGGFGDIVPTKNEADSSLAAKIVFGIKPVGASNLTYTPIASSGDTYVFASGAFIEGWRYGLQSGIQNSPYAVFLPDRFGQPYHMVHSSLQSALVPSSGSSLFSSDSGPLSVNGGVSFVSGAALAGEQDMWLTASIYAGTNVASAYAVNPKCSGIYDRYSRCGMPWFDNDERLNS
jgi:hypothetical protein